MLKFSLLSNEILMNEINPIIELFIQLIISVKLIFSPPKLRLFSSVFIFMHELLFSFFIMSPISKGFLLQFFFFLLYLISVHIEIKIIQLPFVF